MTVIVISFGCCLAAFTAIGLLSARRKTDTPEDYLVASRNVSPWLTALSSVATNNSGFMFIGLIGFTYRYGVQAVWLQLGWIVGDLIVWAWFHRRVREVSGMVKANSVPALAGTRHDGKTDRIVVAAAGVLTFFFLGGYAAAQLKAGSTTLHALFGWDIRLGAVIGVAIVVAYCFSGGIRASIWTDAAQSFVMIGSMAVLLAVAVAKVGGPSALMEALYREDASLVQWFPEQLEFGFGLYFLGFVFGGLGAMGQPHILIRSMAIESAAKIPRARVYYFLWFVPFSVAAVGIGLYARVLMPELLETAGDTGAAQLAEQALPLLAMELLPEVLIGLTLAGIFSATMSTADSQILSCSAALTQDMMPRWRTSYLASKIGTLSVAALALAIALFASEGVFELVLIAWSALGASLGPLLLLRLLRQPVSTSVALWMMGAGIATIVWWGESSHAGAIFKLLPGMVVPLLVYAGARGLSRLRSAPRD